MSENENLCQQAAAAHSSARHIKPPVLPIERPPEQAAPPSQARSASAVPPLFELLKGLGFKQLTDAVPENRCSFIVPDRAIVVAARSASSTEALKQLLRATVLAPFMSFGDGNSYWVVFQLEEDGLIEGLPKTELATPGTVELRYPGDALVVPRTAATLTARATTLAKLPVMGLAEHAAFLEHNRKLAEAQASTLADATPHPLKRYSLRGLATQLAQDVEAATEVLPGIALSGQLTMIFAPPNTGKTLLALFLIIQAIEAGLLEPSSLFYLNVDDNPQGLVEKLKLAEQHGFHMLAEGYQGFRVKGFIEQLGNMVRDGHAPGTILILDTLKRFTDVMDKKTNSEFTRIARNFVLAGGTLIALGHTNKQRSASGKSIFAGTSDLVDDVDCAYVVDEVANDRGDQRKIVEFQRIKSRGPVVEKAAFSYSVTDGQTYAELLASVQEVDPSSLEPLKEAATLGGDGLIIEAIVQSITDGRNAKMSLVNGVARSTKTSQRKVAAVLDRYTGEDPARHLWTYAVRERGAKVYGLLRTTEPGSTA